MWHPFKDGNTIGTPGSEAGTILLDDEHVIGGRITLEREGRTPFAITCSIYGWMMHTRFFSNEVEAKLAFDAMNKPSTPSSSRFRKPTIQTAKPRSKMSRTEFGLLSTDFPEQGSRSAGAAS